MSTFTKGPYYWTKRHGCARLMAAHSGQLVVLDSVAVQRPNGTWGADLMFSDRNGENRGGVLCDAMEIDLDTHPDALLFKHAPDTYAALRALVDTLNNHLIFYPDEIEARIKEARAALAAVDGGEVVA